ncbi:hypothetical protein AAKU58_004255 [Oxalobacteraceae bacterium GrIS 1.18]
MKRKTVPVSPIAKFKDTQHKKLVVDHLIKAARRLRATSVKEASGTCLTASLEFCLIAKEHDFPVELVMWHVSNDRDFCDHWAVRINQPEVVDLTYIQVSNKASSEVVFELTDYPVNYSTPRFYKTAPLLDEYSFFRNASSGKMPSTLIKNIRSLMLKQDLSKVNHFGSLAGVSTALFSYCRFRARFYFSGIEHRLRLRLDEIRRS